MNDELLLLAHESHISPEFAFNLPIKDRKYLVEQTSLILEKKKEAAEGKEQGGMFERTAPPSIPKK